MSKEVATRGSNLPSNPDEILSGLANMQVVASRDQSDVGQFMRFVKGDYIYGVDDNDVEEGSFWAVNPSSFVHGYQAWGDGKLLGEEVAGMQDPPIIKTNLPVHTFVDSETKRETDAEWKPVRGFQLTCGSGEDDGVQCFLSGTSLGLRQAVDQLIKDIVAHMSEDSSTPVAVIELCYDSYDHKKWGKTYVPVFPIESWVDASATEIESDSDEDEEKKESKVLHDSNDDEKTDGSEKTPDQEEESSQGRSRGRRSRNSGAEPERSRSGSRSRRGSSSSSKSDELAAETTQRRTRRRRE